MSTRRGKKLNIEYNKLIEIAKALNENTIANKTRSKENKINTDKFIRQNFGIDRRDFSQTIKDTDIKYNVSTHLYDVIEDKSKVDGNKSISNEYKRNINIPQSNSLDINVYKSNTNIPKNNLKGSEIAVFSKEEQSKLIQLASYFEKIKEMIKWYDRNREKNIAEDEIKMVDMTKLKGEIKSTTVRIHDNVWKDFRKFTKQHRQYKSMDLVSMALVEYMEKYKK